VIVSSPASASLHAPVVPLAPPPDSKASAASKTTQFKNVFDSLTPFEDLQQEGGPGQESAAAPKPASKKELSADSSSRREEAAVLAPPTPARPNPPFILQQGAMLPQSADGAAPDNTASPGKETPAAQLALPGNPSDVAPLPAPSQTTRSSQQPSSQSQSSAGSAPAALARYPLLPDAARLEMATAISTRQVPSGTSAETTAAGPVRTPTPTKGREAASSLETPSSLDPAVAASTAEPVPAKPLLKEAIQDRTTPPRTARQTAGLPVSRSTFELPSSRNLVAEKVIGATAPNSSPVKSSLPIRDTLTPAPTPQAATLRIRASAPVMEPSATSSIEIASTPAGNSVPIESSLPVNSSSPVAPAPQVSGDGRTSMQADSPAVAVPAPPEKPAQQSTPANAQVDLQTPSTAESTLPASTVSPAEKQPDPTLAAPMASPAALPPPPPAGREVADRASETSSPSVAQHEAPTVTAAPKIPLLPEAENFAFAVRMLGLESTPSHSPLADSKAPVTTSDTPVTQIKDPATQPQASNLQQPPPGNQTSSAQQHETQGAAVETEKLAAGTQNQPDLLKGQQTPAVIPHWNDAAVAPAPETGSLAATPEPAEAARPNLPLAAQETHLMAPELPRTSASSEILLHLTGNDESSASIRVADRAGTVNVSVHASDPVLRESLRSNLGELSTQLNAQGWKADVMKSAAVATHSESQQDSHAGGQRGSQQQQSPGAERQPQRGRRANGGQWQQELDQQTTGGDALLGGNR
jgi:hypothetical protein